MKEIPIWEKSNLSLEEAAAYSGIGINKLREITNEDRCKFVLWVGNKRLIKRRLFDQFIEQAYSICKSDVTTMIQRYFEKVVCFRSKSVEIAYSV